jgi:GGDEF domain-containing protein
VLAELGGLEAVNVRDGHAAGDELIRSAARAAQQAALHAGATACRYGGPRLAMVCPGGDAEQATLVLEQAMASVPAEAGVRIAGATSRPGEPAADVVRRAREALRAGAAA